MIRCVQSCQLKSSLKPNFSRPLVSAPHLLGWMHFLVLFLTLNRIPVINLIPCCLYVPHIFFLYLDAAGEVLEVGETLMFSIPVQWLTEGISTHDF